MNIKHSDLFGYSSIIGQMDGKSFFPESESRCFIPEASRGRSAQGGRTHGFVKESRGIFGQGIARVFAVFCFFPATILALVLGFPMPGHAEELQKIANVTYVDTQSNDGDSFRVRIPDGEEHIVRLYFVDCPETSVGTETDARRVRDQTAYFGLPSHAETVAFAHQATARTRELLQAPFTVHTRFAGAGGRSAQGRIYAFVTTPDGRDLAEQLVMEGLARAFGVSRETPEGIHHGEARERMRDLELGAALGRKGVWGRSDPERLVALRADRRAEATQLQEIRDALRLADPPTGDPPDLNTASRNELLLLPGIGPVRAQQIIDHRPYRDFEDLLDIEGLGPVIVETLRQKARLK